jgi:hypothetical protein
MAATDDLKAEAGTRFNEGGLLPTLSAAPGGIAEDLHRGVEILTVSKADACWAPLRRRRRSRETAGSSPVGRHLHITPALAVLWILAFPLLAEENGSCRSFAAEAEDTESLVIALLSVEYGLRRGEIKVCSGVMSQTVRTKTTESDACCSYTTDPVVDVGRF